MTYITDNEIFEETCRVGRGSAVHLRAPGRPVAACGSGDSHVDHRIRSAIHSIVPLVEGAVTCKKCLALVQAAAPKPPHHIAVRDDYRTVGLGSFFTPRAALEYIVSFDGEEDEDGNEVDIWNEFQIVTYAWFYEESYSDDLAYYFLLRYLAVRDTDPDEAAELLRFLHWDPSGPQMFLSPFGCDFTSDPERGGDYDSAMGLYEVWHNEPFPHLGKKFVVTPSQPFNRPRITADRLKES